MVLTEIRLSFNFSLTIQLYVWNAERKMNKAEQRSIELKGTFRNPNRDYATIKA